MGWKENWRYKYFPICNLCNITFIFFLFFLFKNFINSFFIHCNFLNEVFRTRNDVSYCNNNSFKIFYKIKGRALSICWFGLSSAEFILPVLMVFLLSLTTWQNIWTVIAILILIFFILSAWNWETLFIFYIISTCQKN